MPTISGDVATLLGEDHNVGDPVALWLLASQPVLTDGSTGRTGGKIRVPVAADGTFSVANLPATSSGFPTYQLQIDSRSLRRQGMREGMTTASFPLTADRDLTWIIANYVPVSTVTTQVYADIAATLAAPARTPARTSPVQPNKKMVTAFQSGHGWTISSGGGSSADDTSDYVLGTQSYRVTTGTTGTTLVVDSPTLAPTVDLSGRAIKLLMKVENLAALTDIRFYLGDATFTNFGNTGNFKPELTLSATSPYKEGEWCWVTLNWPVLGHTGTAPRSTVAKIRMRVTASSGQAVTVRLGAFASVPVSPLYPNGVASICFDDGRSSPWTYAKPKLDALGWSPTLYLIKEKLGQATYLTLDQARQWRDYSGAEIGCHAMTGAIHDPGMDVLTPAQVEADLLAQRRYYFENGLGLAEGFAWPLGRSTKAVEDAAAKVCAYGRGNTTQTRETWPPVNHMRIRSQAIDATVTGATVQQYIDVAVAENSWLSLTFHDVVASGASGGLQVNQSVFNDICDRIATAGMEVLPVIDALRKQA